MTQCQCPNDQLEQQILALAGATPNMGTDPDQPTVVTAIADGSTQVALATNIPPLPSFFP